MQCDQENDRGRSLPGAAREVVVANANFNAEELLHAILTSITSDERTAAIDALLQAFNDADASSLDIAVDCSAIPALCKHLSFVLSPDEQLDFAELAKIMSAVSSIHGGCSPSKIAGYFPSHGVVLVRLCLRVIERCRGAEGKGKMEEHVLSSERSAVETLHQLSRCCEGGVGDILVKCQGAVSCLLEIFCDTDRDMEVRASAVGGLANLVAVGGFPEALALLLGGKPVLACLQLADMTADIMISLRPYHDSLGGKTCALLHNLCLMCHANGKIGEMTSNKKLITALAYFSGTIDAASMTRLYSLKTLYALLSNCTFDGAALFYTDSVLKTLSMVLQMETSDSQCAAGVKSQAVHIICALSHWMRPDIMYIAENDVFMEELASVAAFETYGRHARESTAHAICNLSTMVRIYGSSSAAASKNLLLAVKKVGLSSISDLKMDAMTSRRSTFEDGQGNKGASFCSEAEVSWSFLQLSMTSSLCRLDMAKDCEVRCCLGFLITSDKVSPDSSFRAAGALLNLSAERQSAQLLSNDFDMLASLAKEAKICLTPFRANMYGFIVLLLEGLVNIVLFSTPPNRSHLAKQKDLIHVLADVARPDHPASITGAREALFCLI